MLSISFLVYLLAVILLTSTMLVISALLNPKSKHSGNLLPFESGIIPSGDTHLRWHVDYFIIAISFVIFDIEAVFIYLWAIVVLEAGWLGFFSTSFFILTLLIGLIYEIRQQAFGWGLRGKDALETHKS
ncbi:MAG: NADH-quinone oxidoreductase subunit A [Gammaproteobacteria bacterium]|nr:NADH-quinone oxidoreductase subunit A [Gammaproteobacteria bacterium]